MCRHLILSVLLISGYFMDCYATEKTHPIPIIPIPVLAKTHFQCAGRPSGYYADVETGCQMYHMCDEYGRQFSYACPDTTLFQQQMLICDHWYMVNCSHAESSFGANLRIGQKNEPFVTDLENEQRTPRPDWDRRSLSARSTRKSNGKQFELLESPKHSSLESETPTNHIDETTTTTSPISTYRIADYAKQRGSIRHGQQQQVSISPPVLNIGLLPPLLPVQQSSIGSSADDVEDSSALNDLAIASSQDLLRSQTEFNYVNSITQAPDVARTDKQSVQQANVPLRSFHTKQPIKITAEQNPFFTPLSNVIKSNATLDTHQINDAPKTPAVKPEKYYTLLASPADATNYQQSANAAQPNHVYFTYHSDADTGNNPPATSALILLTTQSIAAMDQNPTTTAPEEHVFITYKVQSPNPANHARKKANYTIDAKEQPPLKSPAANVTGKHNPYVTHQSDFSHSSERHHINESTYVSHTPKNGTHREQNIEYFSFHSDSSNFTNSDSVYQSSTTQATSVPAPRAILAPPPPPLPANDLLPPVQSQPVYDSATTQGPLIYAQWKIPSNTLLPPHYSPLVPLPNPRHNNHPITFTNLRTASSSVAPQFAKAPVLTLQPPAIEIATHFAPNSVATIGRPSASNFLDSVPVNSAPSATTHYSQSSSSPTQTGSAPAPVAAAATSAHHHYQQRSPHQRFVPHKSAPGVLVAVRPPAKGLQPPAHFAEPPPPQSAANSFGEPPPSSSPSPSHKYSWTQAITSAHPAPQQQQRGSHPQQRQSRRNSSAASSPRNGHHNRIPDADSKHSTAAQIASDTHFVELKRQLHIPEFTFPLEEDTRARRHYATGDAVDSFQVKIVPSLDLSDITSGLRREANGIRHK